jgi:acetoacetate decarboxylase
MTKKGRFTKDKFGYSQPAHAPLYARPPIYYKNIEAIWINYETDEEAALDQLPEGLELPSPAIATLMLIRYPFSTLGAYEEAILGIHCIWQGEEKFYIPHIVVNNDVPLAAGREIWGFPKKMAQITLEKEADLIWGKVERPRGNLICTGGVRPEKPAALEASETVVWSACLRVIPSPEEGAGPSVAELVQVPSKITILGAWQGPGWIHFETSSVIDPWYKLPVKQIVDATYYLYDHELGYGKVLKRY